MRIMPTFVEDKASIHEKVEILNRFKDSWWNRTFGIKIITVHKVSDEERRLYGNDDTELTFDARLHITKNKKRIYIKRGGLGCGEKEYIMANFDGSLRTRYGTWLNEWRFRV